MLCFWYSLKLDRRISNNLVGNVLRSRFAHGRSGYASGRSCAILLFASNSSTILMKMIRGIRLRRVVLTKVVSRREVLLDLCQQLLRGETWIDVELAITDSVIDALFGVGIPFLTTFRLLVFRLCRRPGTDHYYPNTTMRRRTLEILPDGVF